MVYCVAIQTEPRKSKDVQQLRFCDVKFRVWLAHLMNYGMYLYGPIWQKRKRKKDNQVEQMFNI